METSSLATAIMHLIVPQVFFRHILCRPFLFDTYRFDWYAPQKLFLLWANSLVLHCNASKVSFLSSNAQICLILEDRNHELQFKHFHLIEFNKRLFGWSAFNISPTVSSRSWRRCLYISIHSYYFGFCSNFWLYPSRPNAWKQFLLSVFPPTYPPLFKKRDQWSGS